MSQLDEEHLENQNHPAGEAISNNDRWVRMRVAQMRHSNPAEGKALYSDQKCRIFGGVARSIYPLL